MNWDGLLQVVASFLGTLGFCVLFNVRGKKLWLAAFGGFLAWGLFLLLGLCLESEVIRYFIVSVVISIYSEILARKVKTPATTFSIVSLIPLIPGGALYYTMAYILHGEFDLFLPKALYTLELAAALSLGILLVTASIRTVNRFRSR